jgi:hypothetical protein
METSNNWYGIYWIAWLIALPIFMGIGIWYASPGTRRDKAGLSISLKQFVMQVKLTPDEVQRRLTGAVEPFKLFRISYKNEAYEGQWLTADRFELRRLSRRNAWYVYLEIFPYLQNTTLVKVTLRTPTIGLVPLVLFCLNPILIGILVNTPVIFVFFCIPVLFFVLITVVMYMVSLSLESDQARAFLERVFAPL